MCGCGSKKRLRFGERAIQTDAIPLPRERSVEPQKILLRHKVPTICLNCGGRLDPTQVVWKGPDKIECSYCGSFLDVPLERVPL